jgi:UDP-GlcNAc:undecaprenyl-phosphate GlcNAc-1-phosphate transferase
VRVPPLTSAGRFGDFPPLSADPDCHERTALSVMAFQTLATHLLFALMLFLVSASLTWAMMRVRILDVPNHRSSHAQPVPNSGGVAIALSVLIGFAVVYAISDTRIAEWHMIGLGVASLAIIVVSFLDDLGRLRTFKLKLATQIFAAMLLLVFGIVIEEITLPWIGSIDLGWWGYPITLLWVISLTNMFNFMDGLNGLAAGTAVLVAAAFGLFTFMRGSFFVYILCYVIFAAALGFLIFNFPRGRIFMGDVGSQFLGFLFAAIAVIAAEYDASRTSLLLMPLLFFHFIFDTAFTFCRRLLAGEAVTQAHRSHLYQLLNRIGWSHVRVSLLHFGMVAAQILGGLWLLTMQSATRAFVILPFLAIELVYTTLVMRAARRRGLV